ncbi:carbamoyl-phosphate synthase L chain, ATP binding domain-containing protein [Rhizophagus diaphanus]|nr:carbamoyl-phosphate synthase L chain, ATP binding domain-containing protein [Rhizophagus diaphanus] [Rhizophagus sp. MUCL 43196]
MQSEPIGKLLIANRGEIACRIINTCKRLGISTVAVYSDSDRNALFVKLADEAIHLGPSPPVDSYLHGDKIIRAAKSVGADAIHPGYGFLSENAEFAKLTSNSGIRFIGPSPESILAIGDKIRAKNLLAEHLPSVPLIPGYNGLDQSIEVLVQEAIRIGFPVLLKASAGGGGKGMRVVHEESKLREELEHAKLESLKLFGSDELLIEKYFVSVRHVEIQIIGDNYGNVYHCFERDCSIQRRHQKVIEETPSPCLDPVLREEMTTTAIQIGKFLKYQGAGTIEFILDEREKKFYFLEMNTRLQVEHPITELVTGLDLVELQILVAQGYDLSLSKLPTLKLNGHAIECRLYSENPKNNFLPSKGKIRYWKQLTVPNIRYDTGIETGSEISIYYDPLISKISVWSPTRPQSIQKMIFTLKNTIVLGLITNQSFLLSIMKNLTFMSGAYNTLFIEREFPRLSLQKESLLQDENELTIVPFLWLWYQRERQRTTLRHIPSGWRYLKNKNPTDGYYVNGNLIELEYDCLRKNDGSFINDMDHKFSVWVKSWPKRKDVILHDVIINESDENIYGSLRCSIEGIQRVYEIANGPKGTYPQEIYVHSQELGEQIKFIRKERLNTTAETSEDDVSPYISPMPCKILKLLVKPNTNVKKNDVLLIMEAMKMEVKLFARHDGTAKFLVKEGDIVDAGTILVKIN